MNIERLDDVCKEMSKEQHRDLVFKLVWIQNMYVRPGYNQFNVLFRSEDGRYLLEALYPELLNYYTIGSYYKSGRRENRQPEGDEISVSVMRSNIQYRKAEDVLSDQEYALNQFGHEEENKSHNCLVFENRERIVMIPCAVVGAAFYFRTTSMRRAVLRMARIDDLLVEKQQAGRVVTVKLLPNIAEEAAIHLARFAYDGFAEEQWKRTYNNYAYFSHRKGYNDTIPFRAYFPVEQPLKLRVRGLKVNTSGKEKILVFEILDEDSPFPFDKLILLKDGRTDEDDSWIPDVPMNVIYGQKLSNSEPSPHHLFAKIRQHVRQSNFYIRHKIQVERRVLPKEGQGKMTPLPDGAGRKGYLSPAEGGLPADRPTRPAEVTTAEIETPGSGASADKKRSTYRCFLALVEALKVQNGVANVGPTETWLLPERRKGKEHALIVRAGIDAETRRDCQYVTFMYGSQNCCLIEINPENLTSTSTFVLTSLQEPISPWLISDFLEMYVEYEPYLRVRDALQKQGVQFFPQAHPYGAAEEDAVMTEESVNAWCRSLLDKISGKRKAGIRECSIPKEKSDTNIG